jgi:ubiquinone/menaquinone biosynthesis C-methylase UbiE
MTANDTANDTTRSAVHAMWAGVASHWAEHAAYVDDRSAALNAAMFDRTALQPGDGVLELACGAGGLGLAAAERVAPEGEVLLSDVAAEMVAVAADRASQRGLANVRTATLDLEDIAQPDESFDVVLCREGLMFAVDPTRAAGEIHRVLRPGGRAALAVWGPQEQNPWLGLVFDAVSAQVGAPIPPPGIPGPFSLSAASTLRDVLIAGGLGDVAVADVPVPVRAASFDEWWHRTRALAGPLATILGMLPTETTDAIAARLRADVEPYLTAAGLELPGVSLLASGTKYA